jgi:phage gpG-like protein
MRKPRRTARLGRRTARARRSCSRRANIGSVAFVASATEAQWGASWEYAHVHQDGMTIKPKDAKRLAFVIGNQQIFARQVTIPPRPFVGISDDNREEISEIVTDWMGSLLQ